MLDTSTQQTNPNPGLLSAWISAFRPRTLPLALSCIGMGGFMAAANGVFDSTVIALCVLTTLFLQILSNLANDYGDSKHGADSIHREGPKRAVQAGHITAEHMKKGMIVFSLLSLLSGLLLLWVAFGTEGLLLALLFLVLGLAAIWAAINYTAGDKPYGYAGLGDISVFIFFGLVGVLGTYFLQALEFNPLVLLPAFICGFFSTAVLNVNNIRDIHSDKLAGKYSIPVRLGPKRARIYHILLLAGGVVSAVVYVALNFYSAWQFLFVLALPLVIINGRNVWQKQTSAELDPYLKQMAMTTLAFVLLFGIGQVV
ncbi:1,4-dihydroxy-2-naphthoate polyprenyltransferase [Pontibacter qinzhouensis]|uniref:1,4-dihydroxy-2-naphthoate octaprenyltransferase n=1 Tax=Pontibacter qinzhouensis TaxID=2603253 RepID=A0A5C8K7J7_9BACT|nr:1,4-dihydroxy-2-naphthoate polyprenyltransferase [Pontibacter qinzhouensis]TXK48624.1 1,4-dihydroxy-2-naphthoate polyprenyltransferase [Pontibacter qinzhouensis]